MGLFSPPPIALVDDGECFHRPHRLGNCTLLYGQRSTYFPRQALIGPQLDCVVFTYTLLLGIPIVFIYFIGSVYGPAIIVPTTILLIVTVFLYSFAACSDPGIVLHRSSDSELQRVEDGVITSIVSSGVTLNECGQCSVLRTNTSFHCRKCGVCIDHLDHHCPWIGKCVGGKTLRSFYLFVLFMVTLFLFIVIVTIVAFSTDEF